MKTGFESPLWRSDCVY